MTSNWKQRFSVCIVDLEQGDVCLLLKVSMKLYSKICQSREKDKENHATSVKKIDTEVIDRLFHSTIIPMLLRDK